MVKPWFRCPKNLQANWTVSLCIVVVDRVTISEVIVNHLRVLGHRHFVDPILFPITSCFLSVDSLIGPICRHETHDLFGFFPRVDMKKNPIQLSCPCLCRPHFLVSKMTLDVLPMDVFLPVFSFLDQCTRIYTILLYLHYSFKHKSHYPG